MKNFKIKDLVISLGSSKFDERFETRLCFTVSCGGYSYVRDCLYFTCRPCTIRITRLPDFEVPTDLTYWTTTTPVQRVVDEIEGVELLELKAELAHLQKYVDSKIEDAPHQLDKLEKELTEAIEEIRLQKEKLKNG